jgi:hypothetical protein
MADQNYYLPSSSLNSDNILTGGIIKNKNLYTQAKASIAHIQHSCTLPHLDCFACPLHTTPYKIAEVQTKTGSLLIYICNTGNNVNTTPGSLPTPVPKVESQIPQCDLTKFTSNCKYNVGRCTIAMTPFIDESNIVGGGDGGCYKCGDKGPFCPSSTNNNRRNGSAKKPAQPQYSIISRMASCGSDAQFSYLISNSTHCGCTCCYSTAECGETSWTSSL